MVEQTRRIILVVDDEPEITRMLQVMLEHHGYTVRRAHGTAQGMHILESEPPDLVLLDLMMPHLSGVELCGYIRRDPRTAKVPVIVYTAANNDEVVRSAMEAGATKFLSKTVDRAELIKAIDEALATQV